MGRVAGPAIRRGGVGVFLMSMQFESGRGPRVRDAALAVILGLFMIGPAFLFGVQVMGADVPTWLSARNSQWLSGGYQESQVGKHATAEGFASGKLQKALDVAIGNHIPAKAGALLGNAAFQRIFIEVSNALFAWRCYPTYYGSKRIYIPEANALVRPAMSGRSDTLEVLESFGDDLAAFADRHRGISFKVVVPDVSECSVANPSSSLVSDAVSTEGCVGALEMATSSVSNVSVASVRFDDVDSYYEKYYKGDHHWNGFGAWEAFAAASGGVVTNETVRGLSPICMNGSLAREGLLLINEPAEEPLYDIGGISVSEGAVPALLMPDGASRLMVEPNEAEFNFYHSWYGDPAPLQINGGGSGSSLVLCDSFGAAFQWLVAARCETTAVYQDMHVNRRGDETLEERLGAGYDTVYIVAHIDGFTSLGDRFPSYFEEKSQAEAS